MQLAIARGMRVIAVPGRDHGTNSAESIRSAAAATTGAVMEQSGSASNKTAAPAVGRLLQVRGHLPCARVCVCVCVCACARARVCVRSGSLTTPSSAMPACLTFVQVVEAGDNDSLAAAVVEAVGEETDGLGADVVIDCGSDVLGAADIVACLGSHGRWVCSVRNFGFRAPLAGKPDCVCLLC